MSEAVRVRFAPSPTGYLHIGGVRTALFNYLFAKSCGGLFFLRIEDTDRERSKPEFETEILRSMEWLEFICDGSVVRQSERFDHYRETAERLVAEGKAAVSMEKGGRASLNMPRVAAGSGRPDRAGRAIVYKTPAERIKFDDLVHGDIEFDTATFEDLVLIKSDGSPAYNFACVVDDHDMQITHVIRGDDHISNTPKQILLYQLLGYEIPRFGHLPLIVGQDGAPLSKRHGAVSLRAFQEEGFLPEAMLNYLALLGWSSGDDREIYGLRELTEKFSMQGVNSKSACFDMEKLRWLNGEHLRALPEAVYQVRLADFIKNFAAFEITPSADRLARAAVLLKDRIKTFREFTAQADYFFKTVPDFDPAAVKKSWKDEKSKDYLGKLGEALEPCDFQDPAVLEKITRDTAAVLGVSAGALIHPLRVSLTGRSVSPGIFELMAALGKEISLERIHYTTRHFADLRGIESHG